ncbi:RimK family alpha-L-glutamate ligase [Undibacterium sp.]|jgi:glutathione synthase/RimK-type ligase-like ATP-grasp enzyme|uniref:ATP-grasp domain-containing protein n=1 Tax=Undibacterium sp. TaxID=1914977 RepID=UPI002C3963EB|nr:RimK family alpha-L-glutamate ligase [Undibacterium sp.]HTD03610.1 RimK family alpha-L-glutamate ligase [Undibacterium sp.]
MKPSNLAPVFVPGSDYLMGLAAMLRAAYYSVNLTPLGNELIAHLNTHPEDANAMMDLSTILYMLGNHEVAAATQGEALSLARFYQLPTAAGNQAKLRVLVLMAPGDFMANTPIEFLLEDSDVAVDLMYVVPGTALPELVPDHDVLFVAVGEAENTHGLLAQIAEETRDWPRPVLNRAEHALKLSRDKVASLLGGAKGICMPVTVRVDRASLERVAAAEIAPLSLLGDGDFPVIVRPVGSHAGHGLMKLLTASDVRAYLDNMQEDEFFISRFVDYSNADGLFRKYRIVLVEGKPFLCHMAVSEQWMIHYLNAGMAESQAKRDEEARAMAGFDEGFAVRHKEAFAQICQKFGLDYVGIDCAETAAGDFLVFEVDTSMIVHGMDPVDLYPYKPAAMQKVFDAFRALLSRARAGTAEID